MVKYYLFGGKDSSKVASAFAPEGTKLAQDLISDLEGINQLPFELNLVKLTVGKKGLIESNDLSDLKELWLDYQPDNLFGILLSEKLKSIIELNLNGNEGIDWIKAIVNGQDEYRNYYIPRFNKILDVLDMQKTLFIEGTDYVIKPVFALSKIRDYSIFIESSSKNNFWKIPSGFYVNEVLKKAIQKEKLTGISFEAVSVV